MISFLKLCVSNVMSLQGHSLFGISLIVVHPWAKFRTEKKQKKTPTSNKSDCLSFMLNHNWLSLRHFCSIYISFSVLFIFSSSISISDLVFFPVAPNSHFLPHLFSFFFFFYCKTLYLLLFPASWRWKVGYSWCLHCLTLHVIMPHLTVCHPAPGLDWQRRDQTLHLASYYYTTLAKLVMYATEPHLKAFSLRAMGECLVYLQIYDTEMQLRLGLALKH